MKRYGIILVATLLLVALTACGNVHDDAKEYNCNLQINPMLDSYVTMEVIKVEKETP